MSDRRTSMNARLFVLWCNVLCILYFYSSATSSLAQQPSQSLSEKGADPLPRGQKLDENDSPPKGQTPFRIGSKIQEYVNPSLWPGMLILQSGSSENASEARESDLKILAKALEDKDAKCLLAIDSATAQSPTLNKLLTDFSSNFTQIDPQQLCSRFQDPNATTTWADCDTIWIDTDGETSLAITQHDETLHRLIDCLHEVLSRGGFVRISGDLKWLGDSRLGNGIGLLAGCHISNGSETIEAKELVLRLELPIGARCAIVKRQLINIGDDSITLGIAPTASFPIPQKEVLKGGKTIDWVQWQRALLERQQPMFPGRERVEHRLAGGALVIGGGGGMPNEVWLRFVELAGGADSRIVILPTAVEDASAEPSFELRLLKQAGAESIVTLSQTKLSEVENEAFLAELDKATGVWFGGGRQWRFVDAYWGTPAWEKLRDVCKRGGVIGGSSAGATIQGDLLVRGAPAGNHIMIADGYRRGLGLLPGVAIDQHFSQRNRFRELEGCLAEFPSICGLGIDEQTALVVTSPDQCSVIGTGSVWLYPSYDVTEDLKPDSATRSATRREYNSGSQFTLVPE